MNGARQRGATMRGHVSAACNEGKTPEHGETPGFYISREEIVLAERFLQRQPARKASLPALLAGYAILRGVFRPSSQVANEDRARDIHLTPRQRQVARLAKEGLSNPEMAAVLNITTRMVKFHLGVIYKEFGIRGDRESKRIRLVASLLLPLNSPLKGI